MTIAEFLVQLASDPRRYESFIADPEGALRDADLTDEQKRLLSTGKLTAIRIEVDAEVRVEGEPDTIVWGFEIVWGGLTEGDGPTYES